MYDYVIVLSFSCRCIVMVFLSAKRLGKLFRLAFRQARNGLS